MASSLPLFFFSLLLFVSMVPVLVCSTQFQAGGDMGWSRPPKNDSDMFNDWATRHRFHIGDKVYFKYKKDSVLVVDKEDYQNCVVSKPISKFADGNTAFQFDHPGNFYFISGQPGHCKAGQKMIIRVMAQSEADQPPKSSPPPPPKSDGGGDGWDSDDFGPPGFNATTRLSVASCFMTALVAMFIVLYMFM